MRARELVLESPGAVPVAACLAVFTWFAADEGGFLGTTWLPGTLILLATLAVCLISLPLPRPPRLVLAAVVLLAAYAGWSYLSILWADDQGLAWDGANRTVLYAVVFALCALWPIRPGPAGALVGAWGLAVAAVGLIELLRVDAAADPDAFFRLGRLEEPSGYANANVALWFSALWPCVAFAARREVAPPLRGVFLAACGLLVGLTILGQSRAWFFLLPIVLVLVVVLIPGRGRTLAALSAVGLATLVMLDPLIDLYDGWDSASRSALVDDAVRSILLASAGLFVLGTLAGFLDRRASLPQLTARRISAAAVVVAALLAVGGLAAFAASRDDPVDELRDSWQEFKEGGSEPEDFGRARFGGSLSNYRYDYWTVAWGDFTRNPLLGVGADNYEANYIQRGKSSATPRYAHSVELRVLSHTGLVGGLLFFPAIGLALFVALPFAVRGGGFGPAVAGASLMSFAYWVVHGSVDWLWEFPGLGGPAFALLGVAAALSARGRADPGAVLPRAAIAVGAAVALLLSVGLTLPWLAERDLRTAIRIAPTEPLAALDRLDRAADLNPLSPNPLKASGVILARQGRIDEAALRFREALSRSPRDSYVELQLGVITSELGRPVEALDHLRRASALAPRDAAVRGSVARILRGQTLDFDRVDRQVTRDIDVRLGRR